MMKSPRMTTARSYGGLRMPHRAPESEYPIILESQTFADLPNLHRITKAKK